MTNIEKIIWVVAYFKAQEKFSEGLVCAYLATQEVENLKSVARLVESKLTTQDIIENSIVNRTSAMLADMLMEA